MKKDTPYNVMSHGDEKTKKFAEWLKTEYIDKGYLGIASARRQTESV